MRDRTYAAALAERLKRKHVTVYMLSNQLPLLRLAHDDDAGRRITGKFAEYRQREQEAGSRYDERWLEGLHIAAFNDPNDLLSFEITPEYVDANVDSRLCPEVTNIFTHVTYELSLFGIISFAPPGAAHTGYDDDGSVLGMITGGVIKEFPAVTSSAPPCRWVERPSARGQEQG